MTLPLFLVDSTDLCALAVDDCFTLPDTVARHVLKSMRMEEGSGLMLSDGKGLRLQVSLVDQNEGSVKVAAVTRESAPAVRLRLIQALAKAGRDERAIEESTEIGVDEVIAWQADRSIVQWTGTKEEKGSRKWRSILAAATEQSRRAWRPDFGGKFTTRQLVQKAQQEKCAGNLVVALHQDGSSTWEQVESAVEQIAQSANMENPKTISLIVGPEGGISEQEINALSAEGVASAVIGHNILRASTAGPVALSLLSRVLGRF